MASKKSNSKFNALVVAIILVAAAIFCVVFVGTTTAVFSNTEFEEAVAMAFEKDAGSLNKSELAKVKYVEVAAESNQVAVYLGYEDFLDRRTAYVDEQKLISEAQTKKEEAEKKAEEEGTEPEVVLVPEATVVHPVELAKAGIAAISGTTVNVDDLKFFTGAEVVSLSLVDISSDTISNFKNLKEGVFYGCTIDSLDGFSKLDLNKIESLTFESCTIASNDWTPLVSIGDKVTITSYTFQLTEDGQYTIVPVYTTLTEALADLEESENEESEENEEEENEENTEGADENAEDNTEENTEENTNGGANDNADENSDEAAE